MILEYLRLAFATGLLLVPGALVARALGRPSVSATLVWSLAAVFLALLVVFALGTSLAPALLVLLAIAVAALGAGRRLRPSNRVLQAGPGRGSRARSRVAAPEPPSNTVLQGVKGGVWVAGILLGLLLWHVSGPLGGDALFHLARVRKLDAFGSLSLEALDEFRDGGLHPGYAFPLWHGFLALVGRLSGLDAGVVVRHESSVLVPVAVAVAYEAGVAVFRSASAGIAVVVAQVSLFALAAGHGGSYTSLALPPTASRQLLVTAVLALFFASLDDRQPWRLQLGVAAGGLALVLVHPTYALFVALLLGGFLAARALLARTDLRRSAVGLAALLVPTGLALLWLRPVVDKTVSHDPSAAEKLRALHHYGNQLDVWSLDRYRLAPEVLGRSGAVAVAALVLVPLAFLAPRRRWAALVLGGSVTVLTLVLVPALFTHFSDAVSLSQSRRAAGFLPFAFAFTGGLALLRGALGLLALPVALAAGIVLQALWPGDFAYGLGDGGPALATWIAAVGGAAALLAAAVLRQPDARERGPALVAALFCLPVAVHGLSEWSPRAQSDSGALPPGLVSALRARVAERAVVFSDLETSYRIAAAAPVYVAAAPPAHVADTTENRPYARRRAVLAFARTRDLAIPRRYGADWILLDRRRMPFTLPLDRVFHDQRYTLYRLRRPSESPE
jgi:hypothetical protein